MIIHRLLRHLPLLLVLPLLIIPMSLSLILISPLIRLFVHEKNLWGSDDAGLALRKAVVSAVLVARDPGGDPGGILGDPGHFRGILTKSASSKWGILRDHSPSIIILKGV